MCADDAPPPGEKKPARIRVTFASSSVEVSILLTVDNVRRLRRDLAKRLAEAGESVCDGSCHATDAEQIMQLHDEMTVPATREEVADE
jgi:hypothetical protein